MLAPWLVLLFALQSEGAPELRAAAAVTPRPQLCQPARGVWARARANARMRQCVVLAKALLTLESDPKSALAAVRSLANTELRVDALVVGARAKLLLGDAAAAWADFVSVRATSPSALADPLTRHDAASAAASTGDAASAALLYRSLVSERELLPRERRARVLLESALAVLRLGPENVEEAGEYLRLALGSGERLERGRDRALYAFALLRTGPRVAGAPELACPAAAGNTADVAARSERLPDFEEHALVALACEQSDDERARAEWRLYAQAAGAKPWASWVAERLVQPGRH